MSTDQSISITTTPHEDPAAIRDLVSAHFRDVFNEADFEARRMAMQTLYHENIVWFRPSGYGEPVVKGRDAMNLSFQGERDIYPGFVLAQDGPLSISQNLVGVHWDLGPPEVPDLIKAAHYLLIENGKVKILWTAHLKIPQAANH